MAGAVAASAAVCAQGAGPAACVRRGQGLLCVCAGAGAPWRGGGGPLTHGSLLSCAAVVERLLLRGVERPSMQGESLTVSNVFASDGCRLCRSCKNRCRGSCWRRSVLGSVAGWRGWARGRVRHRDGALASVRRWRGERESKTGDEERALECREPARAARRGAERVVVRVPRRADGRRHAERVAERLDLRARERGASASSPTAPTPSASRPAPSCSGRGPTRRARRSAARRRCPSRRRARAAPRARRARAPFGDRARARGERKRGSDSENPKRATRADAAAARVGVMRTAPRKSA